MAACDVPAHLAGEVLPSLTTDPWLRLAQPGDSVKRAPAFGIIATEVSVQQPPLGPRSEGYDQAAGRLFHHFSRIVGPSKALVICALEVLLVLTCTYQRKPQAACPPCDPCRARMPVLEPLPPPRSSHSEFASYTRPASDRGRGTAGTGSQR